MNGTRRQFDRRISDSDDPISQRLRAAGIRPTVLRAALLQLFEVMPADEKPLTIESICERLGVSVLSSRVSTVYRILSELSAGGLLERARPVPEGQSFYSLKRSLLQGQIFCTRCHTAEEVSDPCILARLTERVHATHHRLAKASWTLQGICRVCQSAERARR